MRLLNDSRKFGRKPMKEVMKYFLVLALSIFSSCGARVVAMSPELQRALANTASDTPSDIPTEREGAPDPAPAPASVPVPEPVPDLAPASAPAVVVESPAEVSVDPASDAVDTIATDVELVDATLDPEIERASVVIDAPLDAEVTYRLDGGAPVAAGPSFEVDDVSASEHVLEVSVYLPSGESKEYRLEWDEKGTMPVVSEAVIVTEKSKKVWKRTEIKKREKKHQKKHQKKKHGSKKKKNDSDNEGEERVMRGPKNDT